MSPPSSRVLLVGDFGPGDPGQESTLRAALGALSGCEINATSTDPDSTAATHGCRALRPGDRRAVMRAAAGADAVVFVGGTLFTGLRGGLGGPGGLGAAAGLSMVASAAGKPVALVGVGATPLTSRPAQMLARRMVHLADLLVLRDPASAFALARSGAPPPFRVGADPVWMEIEDPPLDLHADADLVTVVIRSEGRGRELADLLHSALEPVLAAGLRVRLLPWRAPARTAADIALARRLSARLYLRPEVVDPPRDLRGARAALAGSRAVVAVPGHAAAAAASTGIPTVVVDTHPYPRSSIESAVSDRRDAAATDPSALTVALLSDAVAPPSTAAMVRERAAAAEEGFRLLRLVLSGGSDGAHLGGGLALEPAWRP